MISASSASRNALRTFCAYTRMPPVALQSRLAHPLAADAKSSADLSSLRVSSPAYLASSFGAHHTKLPSPKHLTNALGWDGGAPRLRHSAAALLALRSFHTRPGHHVPRPRSASVSPSPSPSPAVSPAVSPPRSFWYFRAPLRNAQTKVPAEYPSGGGISRRGRVDRQSSSSARTP